GPARLGARRRRGLGGHPSVSGRLSRTVSRLCRTGGTRGGARDRPPSRLDLPGVELAPLRVAPPGAASGGVSAGRRTPSADDARWIRLTGSGAQSWLLKGPPTLPQSTELF